MSEFKNTFLAGKMNKDIDSRLMPDGEYRDALNVKLSNSSGSDTGAIESVLSNEQLTTLSLGTTVNTVGAFFDNSAGMIYWFTTSELGDYVIEYDTILDTAAIVLSDTGTRVLNFNVNNLITGVGVIVDTDNNKRILIWTDDLNPIRAINIATAKTYATNGFSNEQINLYKRPPLSPPTLTLSNTPTENENNITERFLRFSHRYRYVDGEISALSPFTETAFLPKNFRYDYAVSSNEGMVNRFNEATIGFNVGPAEVIGVDIVMKESNSNTVFLVQAFDKDEQDWSDDSTQSFKFNNNKIFTALADDQLKRLYDAVPLKAKALELIGNRIVIGNYTEGYNITKTNAGGTKIKIDFTVDHSASTINSGSASETMKSNRAYEIGIVYLDEDGRMSTVLTSPLNTTAIPNSDSNKKNVLRVTVNNEAPYWATKYRFFLKQTRVNYETIVPSLFYRDGVFAWLKLEADEANKFKVGDFIYVKSDSSEILEDAIQTRVLNIVNQPENFLEDDDVLTVEQVSGTYFKIKPEGFRISVEDFTTYNFTSFGFRTGNTPNNILVASGATESYKETPVYYGTGGLDDCRLSGGLYTGDTDIRYQIEIVSLGLPDSFRWREGDEDDWSADIPITTSSQVLSNGIAITFSFSTGHNLSDRWVISAKSETITQGWDVGSSSLIDNRIIVSYQGPQPEVEQILGGTQITITYDDTGSSGSTGQIKFTQTFVSSGTYSNLEEWFYGDSIIDTIEYPTTLDRVIFRRGTVIKHNPPQQFELDGRYSGIAPREPMCMLFASSYRVINNETGRANASIEILTLKSPLIFETIPLNIDESFFYEIGRTYDISSGATKYHQGFNGSDQNQTVGQPAILNLNVFNAFSWGNGFESYKIKDRFNERSMFIDTRPSLDIEKFKQNKRIADLTYSKPFEQSTNFNGINEFNLSTVNFLPMDDKYGSIQKLFSADTNLEVYQENKVHTVLFEKDILFDAGGNGVVREVTNVLGSTPSPWAGEYGISTHPESHAFYGNMRYWCDVRRGTLLRRSQDGITEINKGLSDFLQDSFRNNPSTRKFGAFDLHDKEYVFVDAGQYTVGYNEGVKGFPSFYSYQPQWMGSLNNKFYSFKNGQLYRHYDESNPVRNRFYGNDYNSTVKVIVSAAPSEIKVLKNLIIEGNKPWATTVKSYLNDETISVTQSTVGIAEYLRKEGKLYAYVRRNELTGDLTAKNAFGLGEISSIASLVLTMKNTIHTSLAIGDEVYNATPTLVGTVTAVNRTANTVTLTSVGSLSANDFILAQKSGRVEGSEIRGYNFEIDLVDSSNTRTELYALGTNMFKSSPS